MNKLVFYVSCAAIAGMIACSRGTGTSDTAALQPPATVRGCVSQSGDTLLLTADSAQRKGAVGTAGSEAQRYRLIDEAHTGIARWVNREVEVTGKLEQPRQEGAAPNATDAKDESLSKLPSIRVAQMSGGGDCTAR